jgi:hypothetical protein
MPDRPACCPAILLSNLLSNHPGQRANSPSSLAASHDPILGSHSRRANPADSLAASHDPILGSHSWPANHNTVSAPRGRSNCSRADDPARRIRYFLEGLNTPRPHPVYSGANGDEAHREKQEEPDGRWSHSVGGPIGRRPYRWRPYLDGDPIKMAILIDWESQGRGRSRGGG